MDLFAISCGLIPLIMILENFKGLLKRMTPEDVHISLDMSFLKAFYKKMDCFQ